MLSDQLDVKNFQDLDAISPMINKSTKMEYNLPLKNSENTAEKRKDGVLKPTSRSCKETISLQSEIYKIRNDNNLLVLELYTNQEKLKTAKEENEFHYQRWLQTKKTLDGFQKEIEVLESKLNGIAHWKTVAKNANREKMESQSKIKNLEKSLAKEKLIVRVLQDYVIKHFYREQKSSRNDSEHYDIMKRHTTLQKLLRNKVSEVNSKELQLAEKDKMLDTLKNSKVRIAVNESQKKSAEIRDRIKGKEREIRTLICERNLCESVIAGYKNEVSSLKQKLADQKAVIEQR